MPYQVREGGRWFCQFCPYYSSDSIAEVRKHEQEHRATPERFAKWDKVLAKDRER